MAEPAPLEAQQRAFSAHLRDPDGIAAPPRIEPRRMAIYRELVFNTLVDLLGGNFPILRSLGDESAWHARVRAFLRDHRSQTPLFTEIAREFIRFLEARAPAGLDPPFLVELAHYEWSELALGLDEACIDDLAHDPLGDVIEGVPCVSPLARLLGYRFPVHRIGPAFQPDEAPAQPTLILLVRNRDDQVGFLAVEPLTALLFERLSSNSSASGRECLESVLATIGRDDEALRASGIAMLDELRSRDVLLGTH
jgi:hypothetical protein